MGPLDRLLQGHTTFLFTVAQSMPTDETVWLGVTRIASAIAESDPRVRPGTRATLLLLGKRPNVPRHFLPWIRLIRRRGK